MNISKTFQSRTTWTIIILFLIGGFEAITGFIPSSILTIVMAVLSALAIYFRVSQKVNFKESE